MEVTIGEYSIEFRGNEVMEKLANQMLNTKSIIAPFDYFVLPTLRKVIKLNEALITLFQQNNYEGALPLIRVLMENANYLCAGALALENNAYDKFFYQLLNGKDLRQTKDKNGNAMTSTYLVSTITKYYPAFSKIWEQGNKYVHPSSGMIKSMMSINTNKESGEQLLTRRGLNDDPFTDDEKMQILLSVVCVNEAIEGYAGLLVKEKVSQDEYLSTHEDVNEWNTTTNEQLIANMNNLINHLEGGALTEPLFENKE